jgi:membrane protein implicated in regulation of membrane protease activity
MSINEYLLVFAAILIIIDFVIPTNIPHFIAYGLIVYVGVSTIDIPIIYQVFFGIISYFILVILYLVFWRKVIEKFVDKFVAPKNHVGGSEGLIGKVGTIKEVNGKLFFYIYEELHEFKSDYPVQIGSKHIVKNVTSTVIVI